ncbi:MAG: ATP-binding protein [Sphingobium sp.]
MNGVAPRRANPLSFVLFALLVPLVFALLLFWVNGEYGRWTSLRESADQSFERRALLVNILSEMRAAETSQRGYVITGDKEFEAGYRAWQGHIRQSFAKAERLYSRAPQHLADLVEARRMADAKFREMTEVLERYDARGAAVARTRIADGEGKRIMARLEQQLNGIIGREQAIGNARVADYDARTAELQRVMWVLIALGSLLLAIGLTALWRQRAARYDLEVRAFDAARRNKTILDSTMDAIIIINPSGSIETINSAASNMLGYEAECVARRDFALISDIAPGAGSFPERIGLVDGALQRTHWTDRQVRHKDGRLLPVDIALGVMPLPDGEHIVASLRDIAERKRIEKMKDDLISTVSHELRTPLTSIVGALGLLRMGEAGDLTEDKAGLIAIADNNAHRLIRLINDMLDVDRIDSGKLRMALKPLDLRDTVMRACEDNSSLALASGVALDCSLPDEGLIVQGDEDRLIQVLTNLLSNAVKFTAAGGCIAIGVARSTDGKRALVHVDDEGPGIPEEFRSRIFGRFERASVDDGGAGTGLGLAIAKEIAGQHGGEIWFEDRPGGGTRFVVSLPIARPAATSLDITGDAKILICESSPAIARALQSQLSSEGYACRIVDNAASAREAIAANGYSLLLLDMALDDTDAFDFAREVRQLEGPENLSILMISPDHRGSGSPLPLDLVDWIEKPIDRTRLRAAINASVRRTGIARPTILHLDDDQDTLEITSAALKGEAYILKATTLSEARELLRIETPHIAILDIHLEEGLGLDLLPDLFDRNGLAIPTIIYSAHNLVADVAGQIDAVLVKSRTSLPNLKATVRRVVATRHIGEGPGHE